MHPGGQGQAEAFDQIALAWRGVEQVVPAHHLGDPLPGIVHHRGQLVGDDAVGTAHHEVADVAGQILAIAALQGVVDAHAAIRHAYAQGTRGTPGRQAIATGAGIHGAEGAGQAGFPEFAP